MLCLNPEDHFWKTPQWPPLMTERYVLKPKFWYDLEDHLLGMFGKRRLRLEDPEARLNSWFSFRLTDRTQPSGRPVLDNAGQQEMDSEGHPIFEWPTIMTKKPYEIYSPDGTATTLRHPDANLALSRPMEFARMRRLFQPGQTVSKTAINTNMLTRAATIVRHVPIFSEVLGAQTWEVRIDPDLWNQPIDDQQLALLFMMPVLRSDREVSLANLPTN